MLEVSLTHSGPPMVYWLKGHFQHCIVTVSSEAREE